MQQNFKFEIVLSGNERIGVITGNDIDTCHYLVINHKKFVDNIYIDYEKNITLLDIVDRIQIKSFDNKLLKEINPREIKNENDVEIKQIYKRNIKRLKLVEKLRKKICDDIDKCKYHIDDDLKNFINKYNDMFNGYYYFKNV